MKKITVNTEFEGRECALAWDEFERMFEERTTLSSVNITSIYCKRPVFIKTQEASIPAIVLSEATH